jgi:hypothetical protein
MSIDANRSGPPERRGLISAPQSFVSGLTLIALALLAIWLTRDLSQGTLRAMGPAMLPRWLAYGVAACGLLLVGIGLLRPGERLEKWSIRGPVLVAVAILFFALTIRPFRMGDISTPGLGLIVACPVGVLIGGYASPEARLRELLALGFGLTCFAMVLFGDLLNLPIPLFPQWLADWFPASFSSKQILRTTAAIVGGVGVLIYLTGVRRRTNRVETPDHSGRI